jgi:hypothetical protein
MARFPERNIEYEVHHPSGAFSSTFIGGFTNVYDNVTNVLIRVPGVAPDADQRTVPHAFSKILCQTDHTFKITTCK